MAFANLSAYLTALNAARPLTFHFSSNTVASGSLESYWGTGPRGGTVPPGASVALTDATTGAAELDGQLVLPTFTGTRGILALQMLCGSNAFTGFMLIDRLVHQSGLVGNVTTSQTTNLPTAALPARATGGAGVMLATEVYTAIGATVTYTSITYTNQAGTGSRTTFHQSLGPASAPAGCFRIHPLLNPDTGVQSVQSAALTISTGTAGNWGVTLFKPIAVLYPTNNSMRTLNVLETSTLITGCGAIPKIDNDACLSLVAICNTTGTGVTICSIKMAGL